MTGRLHYLWHRRRVLARAAGNILRWWLRGGPIRRARTARPTAIFVQRNARSRDRNLALALRERGWQVVLLTQVFEDRYQRAVFHEIRVWFTRQGLQRLVRRLLQRCRPRVIIGSLQPARHFEALLELERDCPLVIDHHDSAWAQAHFRGLDLSHSARAISWLSQEEVEAERHCFQEADGVIGRSGELMALFRDRGVATPLTILEDATCAASFRRIDPSGKSRGEEWSVVYAGMLYPMSFDPAYYSSGQFALFGPLFAQEGVHLHLYPSPHHEYLYPEYQEEASRNRYFHLHRPARFSEVQEIISRYDFGLIAFDCSDCRTFSPMHLRHHVHAKFNTYLEAGLPVIVPECFRRIAEIVESEGIGLIVGKEGPRGLRRRIEELDVGLLRRRVAEARERRRAENQGRQLESFLLDLTAGNRPVRRRPTRRKAARLG